MVHNSNNEMPVSDIVNSTNLTKQKVEKSLKDLRIGHHCIVRRREIIKGRLGGNTKAFYKISNMKVALYLLKRDGINLEGLNLAGEKNVG